MGVVAVFATALAIGMTLVDLSNTREINGWLIHTGPNGPAAALIRTDFPENRQFATGEHDGPMFYAIARSPLDITEASRSLDRPQYRWQRPLYPWLARALYPPGSGAGMVWAMFAVGALGVFLASFGVAGILATFRGKVHLAVFVGIFPGTLMTLRISAADTLSLGFLMIAVLCALRNRSWPATGFAVAAVLAKETAIVTLIGLLLARRERSAIKLVVVPLAVSGAWFVWLRSHAPVGQGSLLDFTIPFAGLRDSASLWLQGQNVLTLVCVPLGVGMALVGWSRAGLRHPLTLPVVANLGLLVIFNLDVVGLDRNGTRTVLPLLALGLALVGTARTLPDSFRCPAFTLRRRQSAAALTAEGSLSA